MLARFFQKSEPISFVSLLVLLFFYVFAHAIIQAPIVNYVLLFQALGTFLFFAALVFLSDFIIRKNELTPANYYAVFVFVVFFGLFPSVLGFSKLCFSSFFVLLAARKIYSIRTKKLLLVKFFDSGLHIGVAYLLYPPSGLYLLLIYAGYFIYIRVINKDLLLPILGFLTPLFLAFTYFFSTEKMLLFRDLIEINLGFRFAEFTIPQLYVPLSIVFILLLWGLLKGFSNRHSIDNEGKNNATLVFYHLLISFFVLFLNNLSLTESIGFLFLPIAVFLGNLLSLISKVWVKEIVLMGLLMLSLLMPFL